MEENLRQEYLINNPSFGTIEDLTEETIFDDEIYNWLLSIDSIAERQKQKRALIKKATELGVKPDFTEFLKQCDKKEKEKKKRKKLESTQKENNNITNFTFSQNNNYKQLNCGEWIANDKGVYKIIYTYGQAMKVYASPIPILISERFFNIDENIEKVKIIFYKDKKWNEVIAEKDTIATKRKILQLANKGVEVNDDNAKYLITYFADLIRLNKDEIELKKEVTHLGWANENKFIPYSEDYTFNSNSNMINLLFNCLKEKGDFDKWKEIARIMREFNKINHIFTVASLASPFVSKLNINPFFVHLWGTSSKGKTLTLMLAMSIWGYPDWHGKGLVLDFNAAEGGLDEILGFLKNIPFSADEFGKKLKTKSPVEINDLIYYITGGRGKIRAKAEGGLRNVSNWSFISLTNGEEPLTLSVDEGIANRIIDINENGLLFPKNIIEGKEISDILYNNYGYAGKEMMLQIYNQDELKQKFNENMKKFNEIKTSGKLVNTFSLLKAIDDMTANRLFGDEPLTYEEYEKYIKTEDEIDEADKIIQIIIDEANRNINNFSFFTVGQRPEKPVGQNWGKIEKTTDGEGKIMYYYWNPSVLKEVLQKHNINYDAKKRKLAEKGYLITQEGHFAFKTLMSDGYQRMVKIKDINFETDIKGE